MDGALLTVFIIIDQRIVKEASHTLSLQEAIYHVGKNFRNEDPKCFSEPTCLSRYKL